MGVRIAAAKVCEVRAGAVALERGELRCDACVWAGGFRAPSLARESGLEVSERGRIVVDARLRSVSHPDVYAIGDAADPRFDAGAPIRAGCKYAMPMGVHAAENLARSIAGEVELAFRFGDSIFCINVGRRDGLTQLMSPDGQPRGIITGRLGAWIKERIVRYTVWSMHVERFFASCRWPQPRRLLPTSPTPSGSRPDKMRANA
jgi:NADH dehydrogenase FAD-containing subunit